MQLIPEMGSSSFEIIGKNPIPHPHYLSSSAHKQPSAVADHMPEDQLLQELT